MIGQAALRPAAAPDKALQPGQHALVCARPARAVRVRCRQQPPHMLRGVLAAASPCARTVCQCRLDASSSLDPPSSGLAGFRAVSIAHPPKSSAQLS